MKVLEPGTSTTPDSWSAKCVCVQCGCRFEFGEGDVEVKYIFYEINALISCPECGRSHFILGDVPWDALQRLANALGAQ